jgi:hypothetical protein
MLDENRSLEDDRSGMIEEEIQDDYMEIQE